MRKEYAESVLESFSEAYRDRGFNGIHQLRAEYEAVLNVIVGKITMNCGLGGPTGENRFSVSFNLREQIFIGLREVIDSLGGDDCKYREYCSYGEKNCPENS